MRLIHLVTTPQANAYSTALIFFTRQNLVCFVPPRDLLCCCHFSFWVQKCSEKCLTPSEHICMTKKIFKHFSKHFCLFAGYIGFQPMCTSYSPPWQINPFINMDFSPYPSAESPSPFGCLWSASPAKSTIGCLLCLSSYCQLTTAVTHKHKQKQPA